MAPGLVLVILLSGFHWLEFSVLQENSKILIPWGETRTLPQRCTIVSWLLLPCLSIPALPWLATVWTCPLELREGQGSRSLFPKDKKWGDTERLVYVGAPQSTTQFQQEPWMTLELWYYGEKIWDANYKKEHRNNVYNKNRQAPSEGKLSSVQTDRPRRPH